MKLNRKKIKMAMINADINYHELAKRCGVSQQRVSVIVNSQNVKEVTAGKLARALGVDVTEIVDLEG